jgi:hypothetical protein
MQEIWERRLSEIWLTFAPEFKEDALTRSGQCAATEPADKVMEGG